MTPDADQLRHHVRHSPRVETEFRELDEQGRRAAIVRFNRPEQLNAISWDTQRELGKALQQAESDPSVRAVLITGRGRAFSAGGDIKAYARLQADTEAFTEFVDEYCQLTEGIRVMAKPVVALINGVCAAGGLEFSLRVTSPGRRSPRASEIRATSRRSAGQARLPACPARSAPPAHSSCSSRAAF